MTPSENCIKLLKHFEGCKLDAYLDSKNIPTIGYGNTYYPDNTKVKIGDKITQERAEELLAILLPKYANTVNKNIKAPLTQSQFDALVCMYWNIGHSDTLEAMINGKKPLKEIVDWWRTHYTMGVAGLVKRRDAEAYLFETGKLKI